MLILPKNALVRRLSAAALPVLLTLNLAGPAGAASTQGGVPVASGRLPAGFLEDFALAEDRGAVLDRLLVGTDEHYYFHCLHLQQQGQLSGVDARLKAWRKAHGESSGYQQIEARQALLKASSDPAATFAYLQQELGLRFNDKRRIPGASPDAPTELDPDLVSTETLLRKVLGRNSRSGLRQLDQALLESLVRRPLRSNQVGYLLDLLPRPDVPGLVELVLKDLAASKSHTFGNRQIHRKLSLDQLMQVGMSRSTVLSNSTYVDTVMKRLAPRFPESMDRREDRLAYLERAWDFASTLPNSFVSLKAHLLYHRLAFDLDGGVVDEGRLMQYLRIPRATRYYVAPKGRSVTRASLGEAFGGVTPLGPISSEETTVTACLHEIFRRAGAGAGYKRFVGLLEANYVIKEYAKARLLYGETEESETMIELLGRSVAEGLRERVDIEFARTNPREVAANDTVMLNVDVKNVDRLLVKVFEIDPVAYFDRFGTAVSSALDLDGLVANDTQVIDLDEPPMRRVRRSIFLESLAKPGTYVVELIGGGVSSRAVVVKGNLQLLEQPTAAGHALMVLGSGGQPAKDAVVRFGGRDYMPDEKGTIRVPYTTQPSSKKVLLRSGDVASVATFSHLGEQYALGAAIHTPLEGLLAGMKAQVIVRPSLMLNSSRAPLGSLKSASLVITARTQDGTVSSQVIDGLELTDSADLVQEISVPERVASLDVRLTATVRSMTKGEDVELSAAPVTFPINRAHTNSPFRSFLTQTPEGYALDLLGRAGEPVDDTEVQIEFANRLVGRSERIRLKTDDAGRVRLGALTDIASLRLVSPLGDAWTLETGEAKGLPSRLHAPAGGRINVPYSISGAAVQRSDASLVALDGHNGVLQDHFDALGFEPGYLTVTGLPAGAYRLVLKGTRQAFRVDVLESQVLFRHLVGRDHALDVTDQTPLQIRTVSKDGDALVVQLGGLSQSARVHVVATRYHQPDSLSSSLALRQRSAVSRTDFGGLFTTYESGRAISDEYRYILDRRLIDPFPGNMLTRPGYLLNPWALRATADRMNLGGAAGGRFGGKRNLRAAGSNTDSPFDSRGPGRDQYSFAAADFLAEGAIVLTDLRPDAQGLVRIPIADLGDKHLIQVVALDDTVTVEQRLVRSEADLDLRERRLVDALDAAKPMTQQRRIEFLSAGESFVIRDAPNAGAKTFGSLAEVFELYRTSGAGGDELSQFEFLTRWPSLSAEEKLEKYSEFACHEVHAFLRRKDPAFFESVVVPHLNSKGHATFMDDWLLGRDLTGYLEPWRFGKLNVVEAILLLRETDGEVARVAEDQLGLLPPSAFSLDDSFAEILASRGLSAEGTALGRALKRGRENAVKEQLKSLGYSSGPSSPGPAGPKGIRPSGVAASSDDFFLGRGEADARAAAAPESGTALGLELAEDSVEESEELADIGAFFDDGEMGDKLRAQAEGFYFRDLADTEEFAETHYWKVRMQDMGAGLVTVSPFWVDFAKAGAGSFASSSFPAANRSLTEKLLALAFLDLPFEAEAPEISAEGRSVTLTAKGPMLLALEDIADAAPVEGGSSLLVGQDFFDPTRRSETVDGVTRDLFVTGEFVSGRMYGCRMVVTNPSSMRVEASLLLQIPAGAIPLGETQMTRGVPVTLSGYGTQSIETFFYFPAPGVYADYPVHAGKGGVLLGTALAKTLTVVDELTEVDQTTWEWVSQNAAEDVLLQYLEEANVRALDLNQVAWRMARRESFEAITDALAARGVFPEALWRYAIRHRDAARAERFLSGQESWVRRVGAPFGSPLLTLEPRERGWYEHLAYEPLVNGRSHEFGGERLILNDQFRQQYQRFLGVLTLGGGRSAAESMELSYYLLLQDRIGEAIEVYDAIDAAELREGVQYDYMTAYMAFYRSDVESARGIAQGYADYPVELWRSRFRNVIAQADEIEGKAGQSSDVDPNDRDQSQGALAAAEPLIAMEIEAGEVRLSVASVDEVEIRYHRMDVEFLFSNSPFVRGGEGAFGVIRPSRVERVTLADGQDALTVAIPADLRTANLVVEVRGGGVSRQATYFAGDLSVQGMERYGQIRVLGEVGGKPLAKAYVKVYAQLADGTTRFHKDGYTDLRGRFDYVSLSGVSGPATTRYAVLVMHGEKGASMLELAPPSR